MEQTPSTRRSPGIERPVFPRCEDELELESDTGDLRKATNRVADAVGYGPVALRRTTRTSEFRPRDDRDSDSDRDSNGSGPLRLRPGGAIPTRGARPTSLLTRGPAPSDRDRDPEDLGATARHLPDLVGQWHRRVLRPHTVAGAVPVSHRTSCFAAPIRRYQLGSGPVNRDSEIVISPAGDSAYTVTCSYPTTSTEPSMSEPPDDGWRLEDDQRTALLALAEHAIEFGLEHGETLPIGEETAALFPDENRATFVTLHVDDELNGCIGRLQPKAPVHRDVVRNAYRAAFQDHRFPPLEPDALRALAIEISVLQPLEPLPPSIEEHQIWEYVEPGHHGLLLATEENRGTFLPSVWEKCPDPTTFLDRLKRKAGLPPDAWPEDLRVFRYTVDEFRRDAKNGE